MTAESVPQAIEAYRKKQPDILISDISMPSKDGYDLIQQIRHSQEGNYLPAIALTAYAREEDKQKALEAGFDLHLPKPIDSSVLIEALFKLARQIR